VSDKQTRIDDIEAAYAELRSAIQGVPAPKMSEVFLDDWSAKDVVAHTASWDEFAAADLARIRRGHLPCLAAFKESEVNDWNAFLMRPRRMFGLEQVMFESQHWHEAVVDALRGLPEAMFGAGLAGNLCAILAAHLREHAGHIRDWRAKQGI